MIRKLLYLLISVAFLASCDDNTENIGISLSQATIQSTVNVSADEFNVESRSVTAGRVASRSTNGYLGKIKDPETGSYITCSFMTQQTTLGPQSQFPSIDYMLVNDQLPGYDPENKYTGIEADSCELRIFIPSFYGDSLALMNIVAHEMNKPYEESWLDTLCTDFDPMKNNMIRMDEGSIHKPLSFTYANHAYSDKMLMGSSYTPYFTINLSNTEKVDDNGVKYGYIDKNGEKYNNYGTYLMRKYFNPETNNDFSSHYKFTHKINPGFYFETTGGLGCMAQTFVTQLLVYYKIIVGKDTIDAGTAFAGTQEVIQKTNFSQTTYKQEDLDTITSCSYLKTPASIYTELTIPVDEIMFNHDDDTLNTVHLFLPRINNEKSSDYTFPIPSTVLLVPTDSVESFFANRKVADNRTSYIASYSSNTNGYTFSNVSKLIASVYKKSKSYLSAEYSYILSRMQADGINQQSINYKSKIKEYIRDYKIANPTLQNPFRFSLIPVEATYSSVTSSNILSKITYDMSPGSTRLIKGTGNFDENGNPLNSPVKVSVIYSKFNK